MFRPILVILALLSGEEVNPKGFPTPSVKKGALVDLKKIDMAREIKGKETTRKTYLDESTKERFRTYEIQNNLYRFDLDVEGKTARASLIDRDGDGKFEVRLPFREADDQPPPWIIQVLTSPTKILNRSRLPVVIDSRLLQKTAFQRREKQALPILVLFFVEEIEPRDKQAQIHTSVAMAIVMGRLQDQLKGKVFCMGYRFPAMQKKELKEAVKDLDAAIGSKLKKVPVLAFFTVKKGKDRKTGREVSRLEFQRKIGEKLDMMKDLEKFQDRVAKAARSFLRRLD